MKQQGSIQRYYLVFKGIAGFKALTHHSNGTLK